MPVLEQPLNLAAIDQRLDAVRLQILAHLDGSPVAVTWTACWRAVDKLLDQRNALTGGPHEP